MRRSPATKRAAGFLPEIPKAVTNARGVCDTKVERREKLKESRKILAYPYFRPLGQPRRARGDPLTGRCLSRGRGFVHFVRFMKTPVLLVFIRGHLRSS